MVVEPSTFAGAYIIPIGRITMAGMGDGYGSEFHLLRFLGRH